MAAQPAANTAITTISECGVSLGRAASSSEETMPLPYCSDPMRAAADPARPGGTPSSAAAVALAAITPFMEKNTNTGSTTPGRPPMRSCASTTPASMASAATMLAARSSRSRLKRPTSLRLIRLMAIRPMMFKPNSQP